MESALKAYRSTTASQLGQPAYCVFTNKEIDALIAARPQTLVQLHSVPGFGPAKIQKFGADIVRICSECAPSAGSVLSAPQPAAARSALVQAPPPPSPTPVANIGHATDLGSALRAYRTTAASQLAQPAYCVFTNKELEALVSVRPQSISALYGVPGFGPAKIQKFGAEIVRICTTYAPSAQQSQILGASSSSSVATTLDPTPASVKRRLPAAFGTGADSARSSSSTAAQPRPLPPAAVIPRTALNEEQMRAADRVLGGENCFLTGAAGTGKSYLLRFIIQSLESRYPGGVAVTAPTGIAASHVQGVTIHSWAGIGLGKGSVGKLVEKVLSNAAACQRWTKARALLIDEVSMLDSLLFDVLDAVGRATRPGGSGTPFGGLQIVLCGDFFQLPPVSLGNYGAGFAFQSFAWRTAAISTIELKTIVRQQGDTAFIDLLGPVRVGTCLAATTAALAACHVSVKRPPSDGIMPTKLYCKNANVDEENTAHLVALAGQAVTFPANDTFKGVPDADGQKRLLELVEKKAVGTLQLKIGAQVLLTKNMPDKGLVNGSRGLVARFVDNHVVDSFGVPPGEYTVPLVKFDNGVELLIVPASVFQGGPGGAVVRIQLPLKLAWALTVHKSQGMSLSRAELMLHDAFDYGQVYVALSRVTSLAGLWVRGGSITQNVVKAHPDVLAFYRAVGCRV